MLDLVKRIVKWFHFWDYDGLDGYYPPENQHEEYVDLIK